MNMGITISYLQEYIKSKDFHPEQKEKYFMKLAEEIGELARAMRKDLRPEQEGKVKETVEEELWDVVYYILAIANTYDINLEKVIPIKEKINNKKYGNSIKFEGE